MNWLESDDFTPEEKEQLKKDCEIYGKCFLEKGPTGKWKRLDPKYIFVVNHEKWNKSYSPKPLKS